MGNRGPATYMFNWLCWMWIVWSNYQQYDTKSNIGDGLLPALLDSAPLKNLSPCLNKEQTCLCKHCTDPIVRSLPLLRSTALLSCRHATQQEQQARRDTWWRSLIIAERKQRALILLPSSTNVAFCMKVSLLFLGGEKVFGLVSRQDIHCVNITIHLVTEKKGLM